MTRRKRRLVVVLCLVVVLGCGTVAGVVLGRLWRAASAVQADLDGVEALAAGGVENLDVEEAVELLHTTRTDLEAAQAAAGPFLRLAPYLGWLPRYGADIQAAPTLLQIALDLTAAGEEVVEPLAPLLERAADQGTSGEMGLLEEATVAVDGARPQLLAAQSAIEEARAAREGVRIERLSPRVQGWVERLDRYLPLLEQGVQGALLLPELLGADGPRTYLVLVQNEDELRATGGFISGVARVTVDGGHIEEMEFEDSYAVDDLSNPYPEAPSAMQRYMVGDLWLFRDSNWYPDFPTSARMAIDLYAIGRDLEVDGVIALDQQAIRLLVEALEPLQVEGYSEPVSGENVIRMARQAWQPGEEATGDWWRHRKDFMGAVVSAAVRGLEGGLDQEKLLRLGRAGLQALTEKDLLLYLEDAEAAALLAELGWDGALASSPGDYLMVVDTNMGFNKVNAVVEESVDYLVDLSDLARPRATLAVRHSHPLADWEGPCNQEPRYDATYQQMTRRCYWDYLRVYVPAGSNLLDAAPHGVPGEELLSGEDAPPQVTVGPPEHGREVLATFLLLRPGEELETRFEYALPDEIVRAQGGGRYAYDLVVQKQPGTRGVALRVLILLPPGAEIERSSPEPSSVTADGLEYAFTLETDRVVSLTFQVSP